MNGFHIRGLWFSHQWPRKTRQKKIAKSVVGKSIATRMLRHASDADRSVGQAQARCSAVRRRSKKRRSASFVARSRARRYASTASSVRPARRRSEEHTSELQSHVNLVCRLLLEK